MKYSSTRSAQRFFLAITALLALLLAFDFAKADADGLAPANPNGNELSLDSFLSAVREQHGEFKAAVQTKKATELYQREGHLLLAPTAFATVSHTDDRKPGTLYTSDQTLTEHYEVGVSKQTTFGLSGKLSYVVNDQQYKGLVFGAAGSTDRHVAQAAPTLELTMPLWRNWLGAETNPQVESADAKNTARIHEQNYKLKSLITQAETAYWRLSLARETVLVAQASVERATRLEQWHEKRSNMGLDDHADLLQSKAALQQRLIDLRTAQDNEKSAGRAFNNMRGLDAGDVPERLAPLTAEQIHDLKPPIRDGNRDDVKAALEQTRATKAAAEVSRQRNLPTLEVFGSAALNNRDPSDTSAVLGDSFRGDKPTQMIGLRFSAPLDFGLTSNVRQGWEKEKLAAETSYQRRLLEQESYWNDLSEKYRQAQERFSLYQTLEKAQQEKLEYERKRRSSGRTTTQQVLLFELDYQQAQLGRIQTLSELLQILAQMKLYEGASNESR